MKKYNRKWYILIVYLCSSSLQSFQLCFQLSPKNKQPTSSPLNGFGLTFSELQALKDGTLLSNTEQQIQNLQKRVHLLSTKEKNELVTLKKRYELILLSQEKLLWHLRIPTTGIQLSKEWYPPCYPYLPHFFSLWDLAPSQGKGVRVADINTGVAAFSLYNKPEIRKHRDLFMPIRFSDSYNTVGQDPVGMLAARLRSFFDPIMVDLSDIEKRIPFWILEYQKNKTTHGLEKFLQNHSSSKVVRKNKDLIDESKQVIHEFINGNFGVEAQAGLFSINQLLEPYYRLAIENLLPLTPITSSPIRSLFLSHGSHTFGLIGAHHDNPQKPLSAEKGIVGIAPNAEVLMIKAFSEDTMDSNKLTLIKALEKISHYNVSVVNLSLKLNDTINSSAASSRRFQQLINQLSYGIAASGNNGDPQRPAYSGKIIGYPARFPSIPFSVGAFGYDNGKAFIPNFSQYEKDVGPKFVAPGVAIFSAGILPNQQEDSAYIFLDGTSMASSIISGFVALMLAEFQYDFSREQLLLVCYRSGLRLADTPEWRERTILGALDMRTVLFTLDVLKDLKNKGIFKNFDTSFNNILLAIHTLLLDPVQSFAEQFLDNTSFKNDMMTYINKAQKANIPLDAFLSKKNSSNPKTAVAYVSNIIEYCNEERGQRKYHKSPFMSDNLVEKITGLLASDTVDLFYDINPEAKKTLLGSL